MISICHIVQLNFQFFFQILTPDPSHPLASATDVARLQSEREEFSKAQSHLTRSQADLSLHLTEASTAVHDVSCKYVARQMTSTKEHYTPSRKQREDITEPQQVRVTIFTIDVMFFIIKIFSKLSSSLNWFE